MNESTFVAHLQEALDVLEEDTRFNGPYMDEFEVNDGVVEIMFEDGSRIRLTVEKLA